MPDLILSDAPETRAMIEAIARETQSAVAMEQVRERLDAAAEHNGTDGG